MEDLCELQQEVPDVNPRLPKMKTMRYSSFGCPRVLSGALPSLVFMTLFTVLMVVVSLFMLQRPSPHGDFIRPQGGRYVIVVDAGSTGSRVHVFSFRSLPDGTLSLVSEGFRKLKPGLSSYAAEPEKAAESLRPLLAYAEVYIPAPLRPCTPLLLRATAGLRLLPGHQANAILAAVRSTFRASVFLFERDAWVDVMAGSSEGIGAWLSVNFLLGTINRRAASAPVGSGQVVPSALATAAVVDLGGGSTQTAAVVDLGGGSTQIVFELPPLPSAADGSPSAAVPWLPPAAPVELSNSIHTVTYGGRTYRVFAKSYLGYGIREARRGILGLPGTSEASCRERGCIDQVRKYVVRDSCPFSVGCGINGSAQPPLAAAVRASGKLYAFSYIFDMFYPYTGSAFNLTINGMRDVVHQYCNSPQNAPAVRPKGDLEQPEWYCLDASYILVMLEEGYSLPGSTVLTIRKEIEGHETAWPLGEALAVSASVGPRHCPEL